MTNVYELCDVDIKDFSLQGKSLIVLQFHFLVDTYGIFDEVNSCLFLCFCAGAAYGQEGIHFHLSMFYLS